MKLQSYNKKIKTTALLILLFTASTLSSQDKISNLGIKGGVNYGKHTPNQTTRDYQYQFGFYVGGFYIIQMEEKWQFQPELLYALHASKISTTDNPITDSNGNQMPYTSSFDFQYNIYESTISIPLIFKLNITEEFYFESGPQFGFIIGRTYTSSQSLLDGNDNSFVKQGSANFDFGVCLGTGYKISKSVSINLRAFTGLIKRDDEIKPFVLNLGIEHTL